MDVVNWSSVTNDTALRSGFSVLAGRFEELDEKTSVDFLRMLDHKLNKTLLKLSLRLRGFRVWTSASGTVLPQRRYEHWKDILCVNRSTGPVQRTVCSVNIWMRTRSWCNCLMSNTYLILPNFFLFDPPSKFWTLNVGSEVGNNFGSSSYWQSNRDTLVESLTVSEMEDWTLGIPYTYQTIVRSSYQRSSKAVNDKGYGFQCRLFSSQ